MESLINNMDLIDIINASILIGIIFCSLVNLTHSLEVYLLNKAWFVYDYERIIYLLNKENCMSFTNKDFETMYKAIDNYEKIIKRKEKREKFLNKFRRNKKDV